jgi:hypothetical protein
MKAPPIFLVVENSGDGYHLSPPSFIAWYFDQEEAHRHANNLRDQRTSEYVDYEVEEVPGG